MYKKTTTELEKKLKDTKIKDFKTFENENNNEMLTGNRDFMIYMNDMIKKKKLKKQDVFVNADINFGYGYKLLTQEKTTKRRDVILRICYGAFFTIEETQQALRLYNMNKLYARDKRDALIMACLNERPGAITNVNEILIKNKLDPLRSSGSQD